MTMARYRITAKLQHDIVSFVQAGGFPEVAAEAAGIPREVFRRWMAQAGRPRSSKSVRELAEAVRKAQAQARLSAETEIRTGRPLDWLKCGPGKDAPDSPGWTAPARARPLTDAEKLTLEDPIVQALILSLLDGLTPFPDAHAAFRARFTEITGRALSALPV
jgi:hypothetical protein